MFINQGLDEQDLLVALWEFYFCSCIECTERRTTNIIKEQSKWRNSLLKHYRLRDKNAQLWRTSFCYTNRTNK